MLLFYGIVKAITEKKLLKIGLFSIKTFIGISVFVMLLHFLHLASFKIYFSFCFWSTSIKLKLPLSLHLFSIAKMLGWFPYFKIHSMGYWPPPLPSKSNPTSPKIFYHLPQSSSNFYSPLSLEMAASAFFIHTWLLPTSTCSYFWTLTKNVWDFTKN